MCNLLLCVMCFIQPEGLSRAGDWRAHLAMIIANKTSTKDNSNITFLGDSLGEEIIFYDNNGN